MASLTFNTNSGFNTNNQFPVNGNLGAQNNLLSPQQNPQLNEVFLGQILSQIVVRAILSFDNPVSTQNPGASSTPPQVGGSPSNNPPQVGGSPSNNPPQAQPRPGNQISGSGAITEEGGLSYGGGFRLGGAGAPLGISGVGTTTINSQGYQTSGGISAAGISANAGVKLNSGGLSFSGGIQRAQVGQGIVGPYVGSGQ
jgi:hypothetical protein